MVLDRNPKDESHSQVLMMPDLHTAEAGYCHAFHIFRDVFVLLNVSNHRTGLPNGCKARPAALHKESV